MSAEITLNAEQRLFVIPAGRGYSCLGFDVCYREAKQICEKLELPAAEYPKEAEIGTLAQYDQYRALIGKFSQAAQHKDMGTWFSAGTPKTVQVILDALRADKSRVRIWYGDAETGQVWGGADARPETGRIGRTMGPMKEPIILANSRSIGGGAILTNNIVRIQDIASGRDLYKHPHYNIAPTPAAADAGNDETPEEGGFRP